MSLVSELSAVRTPARHVETLGPINESVFDESGETLTVEEAQAEARHGLRQYQLAEATWGLFGVRMEREIQRILDLLPPPPAARKKLEPRRDDYRREIDQPVYILVHTAGGHRLVTTRIVDISAGGARVHILPEGANSALESAEGVAIGLWRPNDGALWLPARVIHRSSPLFREKSVGLQFLRCVSTSARRG